MRSAFATAILGLAIAAGRPALAGERAAPPLFACESFADAGAAALERPALAAIAGREAAQNHLSARLLRAIITVESAWNPWAMHYEPTYRHTRDVARFAALTAVSPDTERQLQRTALGMTQLVGGTARALGFRGPLASLLDPAVNIHWGALYLGQLKRRYPAERDTIAAFNAGSPRKVGGKYTNEGYVGLVTRAMARDRAWLRSAE